LRATTCAPSKTDQRLFESLATFPAAWRELLAVLSVFGLEGDFAEAVRGLLLSVLSDALAVITEIPFEPFAASVLLPFLEAVTASLSEPGAAERLVFHLKYQI
jgi:hypothetical protein